MTNKKENKKENGAIVVEATIAFTTFIFCILTILMIIDVAYVQAKVGTALNMSAKEMSQYTYLYYRLKFDQVYDASARASKDSKELARETSDSINELWGSMNTITDTATDEDFNSSDLESMEAELEKMGDESKDIIGKYKEQLSDPKGFIKGLAALALNTGMEKGKTYWGFPPC